MILASESSKDNFEDAKDYEAVQLIRYNFMMRIFAGLSRLVVPLETAIPIQTLQLMRVSNSYDRAVLYYSNSQRELRFLMTVET